MNTSIKSSASILFMALAAVVPFTSSAVTINWVGGGATGDWNDPENWDQPGTPDIGDIANMGSTTVTVTKFNGGAAGIIDNLGTFEGTGTFTMDNSGVLAEIRNATERMDLQEGATFVFADDLLISAGKVVSTRAAFQGSGTLTIVSGAFGWNVYSSTSLDVPRIDASGAIRLSANSVMPSFSGIELYLGNSVSIQSAFDASLAPGLLGSSIVQDTSYRLISKGGSLDTVFELQSWQVGSTIVPIGTYDQNSLTIGDADFSVLLANDSSGRNFTVTVVPEPSVAALISGCVVLLIAVRRRRSRQS